MPKRDLQFILLSAHTKVAPLEFGTPVCLDMRAEACSVKGSQKQGLGLQNKTGKVDGSLAVASETQTCWL